MTKGATVNRRGMKVDLSFCPVNHKTNLIDWLIPMKNSFLSFLSYKAEMLIKLAFAVYR